MKTKFLILEHYTNIHDNADLTDDIFARVVTIAAPNTCDPVVQPL